MLRVREVPMRSLTTTDSSKLVPRQRDLNSRTEARLDGVPDEFAGPRQVRQTCHQESHKKAFFFTTLLGTIHFARCTAR